MQNSQINYFEWKKPNPKIEKEKQIKKCDSNICKIVKNPN